MESVLLDAAGQRRSPATMPGYHQGRGPRNKGHRYPADPPPIEEIVGVMRAAGDGPDGARPCALIVMLWRAGLRIGEALDLAETDLDRSRGAVLWSGEARAGSAARSGWTAGLGISFCHGSRSELEQLRAAGYPVLDEDVRRLHPFMRHLAVQGDYSFLLPALDGRLRELATRPKAKTRTRTRTMEKTELGSSMS